MGQYLPIIAIIAIAFSAMILQLAAKPRFAGKLTGTLIIIAAIGGFICYGYGFAYQLNNPILAILRGLLAVCGIFVGKIDASVIAGTPLFEPLIMQIFFWLIHVFALYATASATIAAIGADALRKLRLWLARRGELHIIFGANAETLDFARELSHEPRNAIIFVDGKADNSTTAAISKIGCVLRSDAAATSMSPQFLKSIGVRPGKRPLTLYALSANSADNLRCASSLLASLQELNIEPTQSSLVLAGVESTAVENLQVLDKRYGFGYVSAFQKSELAARLLVRSFPPCDTLTFDVDGKAESDFHALVIGFGQMGQAVLRQLVMNGQFVGSTFRCAVFSPDCQNVNGLLAADCREMLDNYDISLHPYDARSSQLYDYLSSNMRRLKYIAVCTGSEKLNREIAEDLALHFQRAGREIPIHQCSYTSVIRQQSIGSLPENRKLYTPAMLCNEEADRMAMLLNHHYMNESNVSPIHHWMCCSYFNRMSSRASADFIPAMLRAAGTNEQEVLENGWNPSGALLENLSITEHLRWCAFHYAMGLRKMSDAEFDARAAEYLAGNRKLRIAKNMTGRTHACLISWDELDALSEKENRITGGNVDYKQLDTNNVLVIYALLKSRKDWAVVR